MKLRVHRRCGKYDLLVIRPSKWGNPFKIGPDGDRGRVVDLHRRWLALQPELMAALPELTGKVLACVCEEDEECHADILVRLANPESPMRVHGWDLSLNHAAMVELDSEGTITWFHYVAETAAAQAKGGVNATLWKAPKLGDKAMLGMYRLMWWEKFLDKQVLVPRAPTHVAIEDYALRAEGNSVYQIGEQGGIARALCWFRKANLRLHDPLTVKMFGALSGNASPPELADAIKERVAESGLDFGAFNNKPRDASSSPKANLPEYDLASAYVLAWLALTEIKLRSGDLDINTLEPKQIQVFNRVTKTYPTNILGREWIKDPEADSKRGEHEHAAELKRLLKEHHLAHLFPANRKRLTPEAQASASYADCPTCQALTWAAS